MIFRDGHGEGFNEGGGREGVEGRNSCDSNMNMGDGGASFQNGLQTEEARLLYLFMSEGPL